MVNKNKCLLCDKPVMKSKNIQEGKVVIRKVYKLCREHQEELE